MPPVLPRPLALAQFQNVKTLIGFEKKLCQCASARHGTTLPPPHNPTTDAFPPGARAAAVQAALAAGLGAWRAGENIADVMRAAEFSENLITGVLNYISQDPETAAREADSLPDLMATSTSQSKRARFTTARRSTIPVAKSVKKYVKGCMDRILEVKYFEDTISQTNINTTVVDAATVSNIVQGDADTTRDGNTIHLKALQVKGYWADTAAAVCRLILLIDHQPNGAAPAVTDVLSAATVSSGYNHNLVVGSGGSRFKILSDKRANLVPPFSGGATQELVLMSWKGSVPIRYSASTGAVGDMASNNVVLVWISTTPTVDFVGNLVIMYTDN